MNNNFTLQADPNSLDLTLVSLFSSTVEPTKHLKKQQRPLHPSFAEDASSANKGSSLDVPLHENACGHRTTLEHVNGGFSSSAREYQDNTPLKDVENSTSVHRPRKRKRTNDDLEGTYLRRLADGEAQEELKRKIGQDSTHQKPSYHGFSSEVNHVNSTATLEDSNGDRKPSTIPKHETLSTSQKDIELDRASRTVFLSNVSTNAVTSKADRRVLLDHLNSCAANLPVDHPMHKVESLRFRSTAFSSNAPKKAAFARKEIMDTTTSSTNAYAVYITKAAMRDAVQKLNGTVVLGRHLRVDSVAHPAKIDHRRCVFVGNLGFVNDDTQMKSEEDAQGKRKRRKGVPGDVEEGLWQQFSLAGTVENVRVVRDSRTRVGKGIAYVQFTDQNGVEAALLYNDKKFPPLLPRKLRVVRAMNPKYVSSATSKVKVDRRSMGNKWSASKDNNVEQSIKGRASKLLGRAAAVHRHTSDKVPRVARRVPGSKVDGSELRIPESFVFEGHRASSTSNKIVQKQHKTRQRGRPTNRSAKRGAAWKAGSRQK